MPAWLPTAYVPRCIASSTYRPTAYNIETTLHDHFWYASLP